MRHRWEPIEDYESYSDLATAELGAIAFHRIGHEFQGVLACSASWFQRVETADGEREVGPVTPLTDSVFLINYKEPLEEVEVRFSSWLEEAIVRGLKLWQETAL